MTTVEVQEQQTIDRELAELSLLNSHALDRLRRVPSTKIQSTIEEEKTLVELSETNDKFKKSIQVSRNITNQQSCQRPNTHTKESTISKQKEASVQSSTSTKMTFVEKRHCASLRDWIRKKLRFFKRKKNDVDINKNASL